MPNDIGPIALAIAIVVSAWGAFVWWRWRRAVQRNVDRVVELLRQILAELRQRP